MMTQYTNSAPSGYSIAEVYTKDNKPALLRRAWFSHLTEAEAFMRDLASQGYADPLVIVDDAASVMVAYKGMIGSADGRLARGDIAAFLASRVRGEISPTWR